MANVSCINFINMLLSQIQILTIQLTSSLHVFLCNLTQDAGKWRDYKAWSNLNVQFIKKKFFNIDNNKNVSWAANQHIRMISEGSCDTEDRSNDAENSALITKINYILNYMQILKLFYIICSNITDFTVFLIK